MVDSKVGHAGQLKRLSVGILMLSLASCGVRKAPLAAKSSESAASPGPSATAPSGSADGAASPTPAAGGSDVFAGRWILAKATCAGTPVVLGANPEQLQVEPSRVGRVTVDGDTADRTCKVAVAYGLVTEAFSPNHQKATLTPRAQRRVCRDKQDKVVSERTEQISGTPLAAELRVTEGELRVDAAAWPLCNGSVAVLRFQRAP